MCHLRGSNTGPSDLQSDALPAELKRLECTHRSFVLNINFVLGFINITVKLKSSDIQFKHLFPNILVVCLVCLCFWVLSEAIVMAAIERERAI